MSTNILNFWYCKGFLVLFWRQKNIYSCGIRAVSMRLFNPCPHLLFRHPRTHLRRGGHPQLICPLIAIKLHNKDEQKVWDAWDEIQPLPIWLHMVAFCLSMAKMLLFSNINAFAYNSSTTNSRENSYLHRIHRVMSHRNIRILAPKVQLKNLAWSGQMTWPDECPRQAMLNIIRCVVTRQARWHLAHRSNSIL